MMWFVFVLLLLVVAFGWSLVPLREWARELDAWIHGLGAWGPIAFLLLYIMAVVRILIPLNHLRDLYSHRHLISRQDASDTISGSVADGCGSSKDVMRRFVSSM